MTQTIQASQDLMEECSRNVALKVYLKELIERRKRFLGYLRRWDYKRYEWLLEKLNLVYKSNPVVYEQVTRKKSMRKLTDRHCKDIVREKLKAYKAELKSQQKNFFKEKVEKLAFIRAEELACGVAPTVTEEEIERIKKKYKLVQ